MRGYIVFGIRKKKMALGAKLTVESLGSYRSGINLLKQACDGQRNATDNTGHAQGKTQSRNENLGDISRCGSAIDNWAGLG